MAAAPFKETEEKNCRHVYWVSQRAQTAALKATKEIAYLLRWKGGPRTVQKWNNAGLVGWKKKRIN